MKRSADWKREFFASYTGRQTAVTLAAANQALHDAWPYMDSVRWGTAVRSVRAELDDAGLPGDLRPNAVDSVLSEIAKA